MTTAATFLKRFALWCLYATNPWPVIDGAASLVCGPAGDFPRCTDCQAIFRGSDEQAFHHDWIRASYEGDTFWLCGPCHRRLVKQVSEQLEDFATRKW